MFLPFSSSFGTSLRKPGVAAKRSGVSPSTFRRRDSNVKVFDERRSTAINTSPNARRVGSLSTTRAPEPTRATRNRRRARERVGPTDGKLIFRDFTPIPAFRQRAPSPLSSIFFEITFFFARRSPPGSSAGASGQEKPKREAFCKAPRFPVKTSTSDRRRVALRQLRTLGASFSRNRSG